MQNRGKIKIPEANIWFNYENLGNVGRLSLCTGQSDSLLDTPV